MQQAQGDLATVRTKLLQVRASYVKVCIHHDPHQLFSYLNQLEGGVKFREKEVVKLQRAIEQLRVAEEEGR